MENHPIPQDVTGFQFKLIGDMTVKQFAYLAGGGILGWIFFSVPLPSFIKIPVAVFFILLGISLAFLPLAGRPMDLMLVNFIRALFSPTQFVYQRDESNLLFPNLNYNYKLKVKKEARKTSPRHSLPPNENAKQKIFLQALPNMPKNRLDDKEANFFNSLFGGYAASATTLDDKKTSSPSVISIDSQKPKTNPIVDGQKSTNPLEETEMLNKKAMLIEKELESAKKEEVLQKQVSSPNTEAQHQNVLELESKLAEVLKQKERLTQELISLQQRLETQRQDVYTPTTASVKKETKNVRHIPRTMGKTVGLPIAPDVPNLLAGIVKNPRQQPLPNILVEVKDAEENAVRAFKTNGVGQFASATPLINGVYTITFEDATGQNKFDTIEITANGGIIMPLEVISVDTREELRRSLFNQNS